MLIKAMGFSVMNCNYDSKGIVVHKNEVDETLDMPADETLIPYIRNILTANPAILYCTK
jgi:hypothetical protein